MTLVEINNLLQRLHGRGRAQRGQILVQVRFEFVKKNFEFRIVELSLRRDVSRIDNSRAQPFDRVNAVLHHLVDRVVEAEGLSLNADARAFQPVGIQKTRIIRRFSETC